MSDESTQSSSPPRNVRRSSFAGQAFADLFSSGRPSVTRGSTDYASTSASPPAPEPVGPISKAAQQAQQRRLSLTTLGLSGSPNQTSPFSGFRARGDSIGSANSGSIEESAVAEDDAAPRESSGGSSPTNTPFARRTSFGAKALRDIRGGSFSGQGGGGGAPGSPGSNGTNSPSSLSSSGTPASTKNKAQHGPISSRDAKGRGSSEGFNWSENLRSRAERTSSIAGQGGALLGGVGAGAGSAANNSRAKSVAAMEQPPVAQPKPKEKPRPDHFQERILKGDFYMD